MDDEFNTKVMPDGKIVCTEKSSTLEQVFAALMNGNGWVGDAEEALDDLLLRYVAAAYNAELTIMPEWEGTPEDGTYKVTGINTYVTFERHKARAKSKVQITGEALEFKFTTPLQEWLTDLADDEESDGIENSVFRKMLDAIGVGEA